MDVSTIPPAAEWPERIRHALEAANLVLALIGPGWLSAADSYSRRRIDDESDWVRNELCLAISRNLPILPVLIKGVEYMPIAEALPTEIADLANRQAFSLRDEHWEADLNSLVSRLVSEYGFIENQKPVLKPIPAVNIRPMSEAELDHELSLLSGWEPVESVSPGDYPNSRFELRKYFRFKTFREAIRFMYEAVRPINAMNHHPRWENQWTTVTIWLSTWDIGHKISLLDINLARKIDELYSEFRRDKATREKS
jgi:pterin-4a-carbinolamine dehydratase